MKEICIDIRMAFHSGIGTYIRNIVTRLQKGPFKIRLLGPIAFADQWPQLKDFELIPLVVPIYSIAEQVKIPLHVPACDLYWSPHYNIPLSPIRAKKRLTTIYDVYHLAFGNTLSLPKRIYSRALINAAVRMSDHIVTISHFSKEEILKYTGVYENKITPIHLGVDNQQFSPDNPVNLEIFRQKYQLPENYVLFVSNLAPHKNIGRLLQAWGAFVKEFSDWKLVLVGKKVRDMSWLEVLEQNPSLQKDVLFLGEVKYQDLPILYQLASAAIHPSLYEGFGLTPLEAMSCGCPTIVSKVASLPEVCGDCSVYVDPYDVEDITLGIKKLARDQNLWHELRAKGLKRSREFTWDKTVDKHIEILDRIA